MNKSRNINRAVSFTLAILMAILTLKEAYVNAYT